MESICIVTDSTAQFPQPAFPGRDLIKVVPLQIMLGNKQLTDETFKASNLPITANDELSPRLIAPSVEYFRQYFSRLGQNYHAVIAVFLSSGLNDCYKNAEAAASSLRGGIPIQVIDSLTTFIGLGIIVQYAADCAAKGTSLVEVDRLVRNMIPRTYSAFCTPGLSYLYYNGFVDYAQASIGEMIGLNPIFVLEEGVLTPQEKVRNPKHALDFFQEYMDEFEHLQHVSLIQSAPPNAQDAHIIREHIQEYFAKTPFTAHPINLPLATLLGPRSTGLMVIDSEGR